MQTQGHDIKIATAVTALGVSDEVMLSVLGTSKSGGPQSFIAAQLQ
jgi:hypothetical protein